MTVSESITVLSGGTGTPKLLDGLQKTNHWDSERFSVVVNTGDDLMVSGNLVCPDIDTVLYTLSGLIDKNRWFGRNNDTYVCHEAVNDGINGDNDRSPSEPRGQSPGDWPTVHYAEDFMSIGDRDRATHITRTEFLRNGFNLCETTQKLADRFEIDTAVLPVCNDPVTTYVELSDGPLLHFQEFWVREQGKPSIKAVDFEFEDDPDIPESVLDALDNPVLIGPANPVTSLGPMMVLDQVRQKLENTVCVAVSPFLGNEVFSGPASKLLEAEGVEPGTRGWSEYLSFLDGIIIDTDDPHQPERPCKRTNITMDNDYQRTTVAESVYELFLDFVGATGREI